MGGAVLAGSRFWTVLRVQATSKAASVGIVDWIRRERVKLKRLLV
jgi:hypothetical protein